MDEGFCDVSLDDYDGDPAEVFRSHVVRARKPHKCFECGAEISAGADYERVNGQWDGKWSTYSFCLPCSEIGQEFSDNRRSFGSLWEGLEMAWDDGAHITACLNRLSTAAAKQRLHDQWLKWKALDQPR
jgi:hypothetical protein